jgi:hypothetical protein
MNSEDWRALEPLQLRELRLAWTNRFNTPAPPFGSRELLLRAFINKLEIAADRDLQPWAKRRIGEIERRLAQDPDYAPAPRGVPSVGSALVREWNGARHVVLVTNGGFQYGDKTYSSLTQVAKAITGKHRSGPQFFDLTRQDHRRAAP